MPKNLKLISEINPQSKHWTVKVQVIERGFERNSVSGSSSKKYQRFMLLDSAGARVQATIFGDDIDVFKKSLVLLRKYHVSNAIVRNIVGTHRIVTNDYQWVINNRTLVEEVADDDETDIKAIFSFVPFSQLFKYVDSVSQVDIAAVVINQLPSREIQTKNGSSTIQELVVINEELMPMLLTMWDHFVPNECAVISSVFSTWPVIIATRLKVVSFNGLSLSTKSSSSFIINPDIPLTMTLRAWALEHESQLKTMTIDRVALPSTIKVAPPAAEDIVLINTIDLPTNKEMLWVRASVTIKKLDQKFWYMACNKCHKSIAAEFQRVFNCIHCNRQGAIAQPRCRFEVELQDGTGIVTATLFGKTAEKLFAFTATELMDKTNELANAIVHIKASSFIAINNFASLYIYLAT